MAFFGFAGSTVHGLLRHQVQGVPAAHFNVRLPCANCLSANWEYTVRTPLASVLGLTVSHATVAKFGPSSTSHRHLRIAWLWDARGGRAECKLLLAEIIRSLGRHHVVQSGSRHDEQNTQADGVRRCALSHTLRGSGSGAEKRDEFTPYHCLTPPVLPTERIAHLRRQEAAALRHLN